jgi:uncharacterized protein (DUF433 family)
MRGYAGMGSESVRVESDALGLRLYEAVRLAHYIACMNAAAHHPRIARDPKVMMGKPTIVGTRVTVEAVVRQFAAGADMAWVLKGFPDLTEEDVRAALAYAAECVAVGGAN